jgi:hypothetical protein
MTRTLRDLGSPTSDNVSDVTSDSVSDRLAISEALDDYALGVDERDWDLAKSVFTADAALDYTAFGGPKGSRDEVIDWIGAAVGNFAMSQHLITNRRIAVDGDTASVTAELLAPMGMPAGEGKMTVLLTGGCYRDTFVRTPDGWKISARTCDRGWLATGPEATGPNKPQ